MSIRLTSVGNCPRTDIAPSTAWTRDEAEHLSVQAGLGEYIDCCRPFENVLAFTLSAPLKRTSLVRQSVVRPPLNPKCALTGGGLAISPGALLRIESFRAGPGPGSGVQTPAEIARKMAEEILKEDPRESVWRRPIRISNCIPLANAQFAVRALVALCSPADNERRE